MARVRHELKRRPYLVIIDNLEDPEDLNLLLKHLKGLGKTSKFLLTARHFPSADADAHVFPIPEMNREEAISLLRHQSDLVGATDFARLPDKELTQLYHIVGGHPQALRLLPSLTRLYTLPQIIAGWHDGRTGYVAQMYEMIYARLWGILQPGEQKLLVVMPLTAYTGALPAQMQVLCSLPDQDFWAALTRLVELCLITPRGTLYEKRYGIHSLTEHFLASLTARSDALRALHEASAVANVAYWRRFLETLPEDHRQKIDVERAHIFRAIHFSLRLPATAVSKSLRQDWLALASHLYRFASQRGFAGEWIPYLEQMIPLFDGNPAVQSSLLNQLGKLYRQAQQIPEAIATHQRFETLARKMGDDVEIARASFALGTDYFSHRDIDTAIHYAQKALDIFTQLDQYRQEKAAVLNLLGAITQSRHDLNASQAYLETAVSIWREIGSVPDLARALNNLALTYQQQDQITSAFACYQEALTALAGSASELDRTLIYLSQGSLYFDTGQYREANAAFNNINLSFLRRSGHLLYLALALNNLGNTAYMQASYHKAEDFLQESASLWRELEIPLELVNTLGRLGDVYRMLEKQDTALSLYEEALHIIASLAGETSGENKRAQQLRHEIQQLRDDLLRRQRGGVDQNDG